MNLSKDMNRKIMSYLEFNSLINLAQTCKYYKSIFDDDRFWKMKFWERFSCYDRDHMKGYYKQWYWRFYKKCPYFHHENTYSSDESHIIETFQKTDMGLLNGDIVICDNNTYIYDSVKLFFYDKYLGTFPYNLKIIKDYPIDYWKNLGFNIEYHLDKSLFETSFEDDIEIRYVPISLTSMYFLSFTYNQVTYYITDGQSTSRISKEKFVETLKGINYIRFKIFDLQNKILEYTFLKSDLMYINVEIKNLVNDLQNIYISNLSIYHEI